MTTPAAEPVDAATTGDRDAIARDIERTREELGETVEALTRRLDVKSRMKDKVASSRHRAASRPPVTAAVVLGVVALVAGYVVWRRRR
jgi:type VI protein secretion system component VasF